MLQARGGHTFKRLKIGVCHRGPNANWKGMVALGVSQWWLRNVLSRVWVTHANDDCCQMAIGGRREKFQGMFVTNKKEQCASQFRKPSFYFIITQEIVGVVFNQSGLCFHCAMWKTYFLNVKLGVLLPQIYLVIYWIFISQLYQHIKSLSLM